MNTHQTTTTDNGPAAAIPMTMVTGNANLGQYRALQTASGILLVPSNSAHSNHHQGVVHGPMVPPPGFEPSVALLTSPSTMLTAAPSSVLGATATGMPITLPMGAMHAGFAPVMPTAAAPMGWQLMNGQMNPYQNQGVPGAVTSLPMITIAAPSPLNASQQLQQQHQYMSLQQQQHLLQQQHHQLLQQQPQHIMQQQPQHISQQQLSPHPPHILQPQPPHVLQQQQSQPPNVQQHQQQKPPEVIENEVLMAENLRLQCELRELQEQLKKEEEKGRILEQLVTDTDDVDTESLDVCIDWRKESDSSGHVPKRPTVEPPVSVNGKGSGATYAEAATQHIAAPAPTPKAPRPRISSVQAQPILIKPVSPARLAVPDAPHADAPAATDAIVPEDLVTHFRPKGDGPAPYHVTVRPIRPTATDADMIRLARGTRSLVKIFFPFYSGPEFAGRIATYFFAEEVEAHAFCVALRKSDASGELQGSIALTEAELLAAKQADLRGMWKGATGAPKGSRTLWTTWSNPQKRAIQAENRKDSANSSVSGHQ